MPIAILPHRAIISLHGEEVIDFLQGLISSDARKLLKNEAIYAAMLSPQGRFLHDFFLVPCGEKIYVDVAANRADDLLARLKMYRLRSKVEIQREGNLSVAVYFSVMPDASFPSERSEMLGKLSDVASSKKESLDTSLRWYDKLYYQDPRLPELGFRIIGNIEENFAPPEEYEKLRISLCVPDTADMIVDKSLLLECGFEELHGVDFNKGCYVGQEVTARSKFRGSVRKSLYHVESLRAEGETIKKLENGLPHRLMPPRNDAKFIDEKLPALGAKIMAGDKEIGELRTSINNVGIAIINNEEFEAAKTANIPFLCDGKTLRINQPIWRKLVD